jgi:dUTP pyrophosphatase
VCLLNTSSKTWHVNVGDRIAQLVVQSFVPTTFIAVDRLDDSDRGEHGFGSTGVAGR